MRGPAQIWSWISEEELLVWIREAADRETYQKRLAIWLTKIGPFHAHEVARMLGVSKQAVWLWVGQYNKEGPEGLVRQGRGGRRSFLLSVVREAARSVSTEPHRPSPRRRYPRGILACR